MAEIDEILQPLLNSDESLFWQGPASEASLNAIASQLELKLPPSFRSFLLKYGGGGVVGELIGGLEEDNPALEYKGTVIGDTKRCRADHQLPHSLCVIYLTDADVCWCLDCSKRDENGESPVVSYSVFEQRVDVQIASTFEEFLKQYVELRSNRT
jgi:hypothetical protein